PTMACAKPSPVLLPCDGLAQNARRTTVGRYGYSHCQHRPRVRRGGPLMTPSRMEPDDRANMHEAGLQQHAEQVHDLEAEARSILQSYPERRSAIMPLLHACQDRRGYLAAEDIERVAAWIGETPAYVESVASFYVLYRRKPHGKICLTVCTNLSC